MSSKKPELYHRVSMLVDPTVSFDRNCSRSWMADVAVVALTAVGIVATWNHAAARTPNEQEGAAQKQDDPSTGVNENGAGKPTPVERDRLRYAKRDFTYWQDVFETDLDIVTKTEALVALNAFGENRYRNEVVDVVGRIVRDSTSQQLFAKAVDTLVSLNGGDALIPSLKEGGEFERESSASPFQGGTVRRHRVAGPSISTACGRRPQYKKIRGVIVNALITQTIATHQNPPVIGNRDVLRERGGSGGIRPVFGRELPGCKALRHRTDRQTPGLQATCITWLTTERIFPRRLPS